jgi:ATP-dependent DNA helicase RecG
MKYRQFLYECNSQTTTDNIREIHCARNPKIMMFLHEYGLVKDLGEGVNRMFIDMEAANQPFPEYRQVEFMLKVRAISAFKKSGGTQCGTQGGTQEKILKLIEDNNKISLGKIAQELNISRRTVAREIAKMPMLRYVGSGYSGHWEINVDKE